MATVKEIILRLRAAGYSQTRIAHAIGVPQPRISRWERGEAPDAADDALALANLLAAIEQAEPSAPRPDLAASTGDSSGDSPHSRRSPLPLSGQGANSAQAVTAARAWTGGKGSVASSRTAAARATGAAMIETIEKEAA